ncbi:MAG: PKD domain-containing protein [Desulfobacterales bacterium]|nr:PKD domain-containing protein [Desulfobacterales bacterium]
MKKNIINYFIFISVISSIFLGFGYIKNAYSISYTYDSLARLTKVDYGNGVYIVYTYDEGGNVTRNETVGGMLLPVADFTATPSTGSSPLEVSFADQSANNPSSWAWDFGDGEYSSIQNPIHTYTAAGKYNVTLTASNSAGEDTKTKNAYIYVTYSEAKDPFAEANLFTGFDSQLTGANLNATKENGEPNHAGNLGGKSVWWKWVATVNSKVSVDTHGSDFNTLLAVYTGKSVDKLICIASNDDDGSSNGNSGLSFFAENGLTYYIAVDGYNEASGNIVFNFNVLDQQIVVDFADKGLWMYDGKWAQIAKNNPTALEAYDKKAVGNFSNYLYEYDGNTWNRIATTSSESMLGIGAELFVDFGINGVYKYNNGWRQIAKNNPTIISSYHRNLVGKFDGYLYKYDGNNWVRIATTPSESMLGIGAELFVDFGINGVYKYDNKWTQVAKNDPTALSKYNGKLVGKFSGYLYEYDGNIWTRIATNPSEDMVGIGDTLFVDFGDKGVHKYINKGWLQIAKNNPTILTTYNGKLVGKFSGYLYEYDGNIWTRIATNPSEDIIAVSLK